MAAFKQHCAFGFWKGKLLFGRGPASVTRKDAMGHFGRITSIQDLPEPKRMVAYVKEAARLNEAGIEKPASSRGKERKDLVIPDDLTAALRKNRKARTTFAKFSHSHRKEYVEWITEAKREETRQRRLQQTIAWVADGRPRHWKYQNC